MLSYRKDANVQSVIHCFLFVLGTMPNTHACFHTSSFPVPTFQLMSNQIAMTHSIM